MKDLVVMTGGSLSLTLRNTGHGAALARVTDGGHCIYDGVGQPFFGLEVQEGTQTRQFLSHTDFGAFSAETVADGTRLCFSSPGGLDGIDVIIFAAADGDGLRFTCFIDNRRGDCSITGVEYPRLWFTPGTGSRYFCPTGCGLVLEGLDAGPHRRRMRYPSYQASMSYCAVYDLETGRGVYVGYEDESASLKQLMIRREEGEDGSCLSCTLPARELGEARNSQQVPGACVWRAYDGQWYEAALEYKKFALRSRRMPPTDALGLRRDRHEALWNCGHWWLSFSSEEGADRAELISLYRSLGVPCAVHVYNWHEIPFDNDYPHFFPAKAGCSDYLAQLREADLLTMPYINGRLWDTRDRGLEDYQFTSVALPYVTKDEKGDPITEWYAVKEEDGSMVLYGVMCPSTSLWQDKVAELGRGVLQDLGCDGLYIDQTASAPPRMCCDRSHAHAPGNGGWWVDDCSTVSRRILRENGAGKFLTSEGTTDAYFGCFDAFLGWSWWYNGQVPALAAVYSGIALCFGRQYGDVDDDTMRILAAQSLTFGECMGWITATRFKSADDFTREFYCACVRMSYEHREVLRTGELCRPPRLTASAPPLTGKTSAEDITSPPALAYVWRDRISDRRFLCLAAPGRQACEVTLRSEHVRSAPVFTGTHGVECRFAEGELSLTLPAGSVLWAEL